MAPLRRRGGSVSAEHGIGLEKKAYLGWSRGPAEIALMAALKRALDPRDILNPGKIFALRSGCLTGPSERPARTALADGQGCDSLSVDRDIQRGKPP